MRVLRSNKDSVMAMLEAFVHDPLINWRLLNTTTDAVDAGNTPTADSSKCFDVHFVHSLTHLIIVFP